MEEKKLKEIEFDLQSDMQSLADCNAIEMYENGNHICFPYMMNDAAECFIELMDCVVRGSLIKDYQGRTSIYLTQNGASKGLIISQGHTNTVTIWYKKAKKYLNLYHYHEIGHFWVKGNERWRRLVYIVGTMNEKECYLGEGSCVKTEKHLIPLIEFAPFRYFSPVHVSLDVVYANTTRGWKCFAKLAEASGSKKAMWIAKRYKKRFEQKRINPVFVKAMAMLLAGDDVIYEYIDKKVTKASLNYEERPYSEEQKAEMKRLREEAERFYLSEGYEGSYPVFEKKGRSVHLYEEHPYLMDAFEYENYQFRIQEMVLSK